MSRRPSRNLATPCDGCELEALQEEVKELKTRLDSIEARYRTVMEAEETWSEFMHEKDNLVFINGAGDIARMPRHLALLIGEARPFDGEIRGNGAKLRFVHQGEVIAQVPKSLVNRLKGLLKRGEDRGKS